MPSIKTLEVVARPSVKDGHFWSTSFMLFDSDEATGAHRTEISGTDVADFAVNAINWLGSLDLPEEFHGWSWSVRKGTARWPNGFKARFERNSHILQVREVA